MKINNVTEIRPDDFKQEDRDTVGQLGEILNPFMQQVVEIADNRIDFENRVENFLQVEFTVDSNGKPILNNKLRTGKTSIRGFQVIAAFNLTNNSIKPTSQPFISYTPLSGDIVQIEQITGLVADNKFRLNIIVY